jgi:ABC-type antimicrobial peptide transport system permease subunit
VPDELPALVYTLDAALLLVVLTTLAAVAGLAVRERIRELGILRAIGLTPRQVLSTLVTGQVVLAAAASLLAVPLGLGLYLALVMTASGTTEDVVLPSWWALASVPVATVLLAIAAVSLPARLALRARVAETLRYQ